jgi:hypothetical protein
MMKSVLSDKCCKKEEKPFPKLMQTDSLGSVYLMSSSETGTVVYVATGSGLLLGRYRDGMTPDGLKDYEGDVCLTND